MTRYLHTGRIFEETVETVYRCMGYSTRYNHVLHTRPARIHAEIYHPAGKQRVLIECKHSDEEPVSIQEVERFCSRVAHAREHSIADTGLLVSKTHFNADALAWAQRNCSFVELKTYKQIIYRSVSFKKLLKKFHH